MSSGPPSPRLALVLGGLLLLAAGCGRPPELDMDRVASKVRSSLASTYELSVTAPRCPDQVEVEKGRAFTCRVRIADIPLTVEVTQRDTDGNLRIQPTAAVLDMEAVRSELTVAITAQLEAGKVDVDCGADEVKVVPPGGTFECSASDGVVERGVTARVRDRSGSLTYSIDEG